MKNFFSALTALLLLAAVPVAAEAEMSERPGWTCTQEEKAGVTVNFKFSTKDVSSVHADMQQREKDIRAMAGKAGLKTVSLKSSNYNTRNAGKKRDDDDDAPQKYKVTGSMNFEVEPAGKAGAFVALLGDKDYDANLSVRSYNKCKPDPSGQKN